LLAIHKGFIFFRKLYLRLGGPEALEFYQSVPKSNYHFAYINSARNYIINCIETFFSSSHPQTLTMFANKQVYVIHEVDQNCSQESGSSQEPSVNHVSDFIDSTYPKQKKYLALVGKILEKHNLINDDLFFVDFNDVHIADFFSFINNSFDKQKENTRLTKVCKFMQSKNIRFANVCVKNIRAKKYLC